ncbi:unnamed protein product, partial [Discosporangium mesarthrocarpum]
MDSTRCCLLPILSQTSTSLRTIGTRGLLADPISIIGEGQESKNSRRPQLVPSSYAQGNYNFQGETTDERTNEGHRLRVCGAGFPRFSGDPEGWRRYVKSLDTMLLEKEPRAYSLLHGERRPGNGRKNDKARDEWDKVNSELFTILFMTCTGSANPILQSHRARVGKLADGVGAFKALNHMYTKKQATRHRRGQSLPPVPTQLNELENPSPSRSHTARRAGSSFFAFSPRRRGSQQTPTEQMSPDHYSTPSKEVVPTLSGLRCALNGGRHWYEVFGLDGEEAARIPGSGVSCAWKDALDWTHGDMFKRTCCAFRTLYDSVKALSSPNEDMLVLVHTGACITRCVLGLPRTDRLSPGALQALEEFEKEVGLIKRLADGCVGGGGLASGRGRFGVVTPKCLPRLKGLFGGSSSRDKAKTAEHAASLNLILGAVLPSSRGRPSPGPAPRENHGDCPLSARPTTEHASP